MSPLVTLYPDLPMFFNVDFSHETLKNMGRPGCEATLGSNKVVGRKGIQVLVLGAHYHWIMEHPWVNNLVMLRFM